MIPHAVRYPMDWPASRAAQKGVDVQLAIDFIAGALDDRYEVGVGRGHACCPLVHRLTVVSSVCAGHDCRRVVFGVRQPRYR